MRMILAFVDASVVGDREPRVTYAAAEGSLASVATNVSVKVVPTREALSTGFTGEGTFFASLFGTAKFR